MSNAYNPPVRPLLHEAVDPMVKAASQSRGTTVLVVGPAGTGKSHLLHQVATNPPHHPVAFAVSSAASGSVAFGPWRTVLEATRRRRQDHLLGAVPSSTSTPQTPREFADRLLALWATIDAPVLVLLDDVDDLDPSSWQVVEHLHAGITHEAVVLVLATRHDELITRLRATGSETPLVSVAVPGWTAGDIAELLRAKDPSASPSDIDRAARLLEVHGDGHPLTISCRVERLERHVAITDLVRAVLDDPTVTGAASSNWLRDTMDELDPHHREILARWILAPSLTRTEWCTCTGVTRHELDEAIAAATDRGLMPTIWATPTEIPTMIRELLMSSLTPALRALSHLQLGRFFTHERPGSTLDAAHHLERAVGAASPDEVVDALDAAAEAARASFAHGETERLLHLADEMATTSHGRARRLLRRAEALRALGRYDEAHDLARRAVHLARHEGDADLLAEAAVSLTLPSDWRVGDRETQHSLEQALEAQPSPEWRVRALAGLALQRFQVPRSDDDLHRWSWQFRPDLAASLAEAAVTTARGLDHDDDALVTALLSWRSVHRQPDMLIQRRRVSSEAMSLALRRRDPAAMVQSAVRVAVDELESCHRDGFEHAVVTARWAADQSGSAVLLWRAHVLEATRAVLDNDLEALERAKHQAVRAGRQASAPGREVTELALDRHVVALSNGWSVFAALRPDDDWPALHHPLGVAGGAEAMARAGRFEQAQRLLRRLRWPADTHTSMLLVSTLAARAAVLCGDEITAAAVLPTLVHYAGHTAVDPEALWVEGPVALAAAQVAELLGHHELVAGLVAQAVDMNQGLDCARTAALLATRDRRPERRLALPEREHTVLRLLADGLGNAQIAASLNVSVSTIRRETTTLYHRLGVSNRAGAVTRGHELGLL